MVTRPRQGIAYLTAIAVLLFSTGYCWYVSETVAAVDLDASAWAILLAKTMVELVASAYGLAFLIGAVAYLLMRDDPDLTASTALPPVGIIYLCCDDMDVDAVESLTRLSYEGPLYLLINDDSRSEDSRRAVSRIASSLAGLRDWQVHVLRRFDNTGGKAGAVNHVLAETAHLYEYFILCDNDSTVLNADTIQRGLAHVRDASIGVVQFRSVPVDDPNYCPANRRLAASIGAFHAFLALRRGMGGCRSSVITRYFVRRQCSRSEGSHPVSFLTISISRSG